LQVAWETETSLEGLTLSELDNNEEIGMRTIDRELYALQDPGFPVETKKAERAPRWAFIAIFKFKISLLSP
jgi:hypothetical protein